VKVTVDLNILLDVAQQRMPYYDDSEEVLHRARTGEFNAVLPGHALTTLHYIIEKYSGTELANQTIDGLLADFDVSPAGKAVFLRARQLMTKDFEDAVVIATAESTGSHYIITRNPADFSNSPIPAITPKDFLEELASEPEK
jgi:hypothetical protein